MSGSASFERGWGTARAPLPRHLYSIGPGHTEANQGARDHNEMFFIGIQCDYENSIGFLLRQLKLRGLITENQHQGRKFPECRMRVLLEPNHLEPDLPKHPYCRTDG